MQVEVVWSPLALARLQGIRAFVALDNPDAAERMAMRIIAIVEALRSHPRLGRAGAGRRDRELVIGGTPYIVKYHVKGNRVVIRTIWHAAQEDNS